ncbi:hypothetical protein TSUD_264700 [Trifolium subterraneum]|uniref:Uncharacterized protein n=1 Tax=Trifolium subterraneum TaxID=3900 RepID=A0A2Z6MSL4_TRISU|nr:hypothetical protein TSUD_264700 [Trifolium subterraneum]
MIASRGYHWRLITTTLVQHKVLIGDVCLVQILYPTKLPLRNISSLSNTWLRQHIVRRKANF